MRTPFFLAVLLIPPSWQLGTFTRPTSAPVITPDKSHLQRPSACHACPLGIPPHLQPAAILRDGKIFVLYRAEDDSGEMKIGLHTSRLGLASSTDGIHFERHSQPRLSPPTTPSTTASGPAESKDPRIVQSPDGNLRHHLHPVEPHHLLHRIATSPDLIHWTKHDQRSWLFRRPLPTTCRTNPAVRNRAGWETTSKPPASTAASTCTGAKAPSTSPPPATSSAGLRSNPLLANHWKSSQAPRPLRLRIPRGRTAALAHLRRHRHALQRQERPRPRRPHPRSQRLRRRGSPLRRPQPAKLLNRTEAPVLNPSSRSKKTGQYAPARAPPSPRAWSSSTTTGSSTTAAPTRQ